MTSSSCGGRPLEERARLLLERTLGADFHSVVVHEAPGLASLGVRACASGEHLYFAPGLYAPETDEGLALIAHELVHVLQQRAGRVRGGVNTDPALEQERGRGR